MFQMIILPSSSESSSTRLIGSEGEGTVFLQTLGTACLVAQNHISEELNVQFDVNIDCVNKLPFVSA